MKLFIVKELYSDDDGNVGCDLYYFENREEAVDKVNKIHETRLNEYTHFYSYNDETEVDDDYDNDGWFDLSLSDDIAIRTICSIEVYEK